MVHTGALDWDGAFADFTTPGIARMAFARPGAYMAGMDVAGVMDTAGGMAGAGATVGVGAHGRMDMAMAAGEEDLAMVTTLARARPTWLMLL